MTGFRFSRTLVLGSILRERWVVMAEHPEYGDVATTVSVDSIKAGMEQQLAATGGGRSPILSKQIELSAKTVNVSAQGFNTTPVEAEIKLLKLKPGELGKADQTPEVKSRVDNTRLSKMLEASGYGTMADDLRALDQGMKLDGGAMQPDGTMGKDPRLAHRMNHIHSRSKKIFGLNDQGLNNVNRMRQPQINALVQTAQTENPQLAGANLTPGRDGVPQAVHDLNKTERAAKAEALNNPANVQKITIGAVGLNFKTDRKNTIEKGADFVPEHQKTKLALAPDPDKLQSNGRNGPALAALRRQHQHNDLVAPAPQDGALHVDADGKPVMQPTVAPRAPEGGGLFGAIAAGALMAKDAASPQPAQQNAKRVSPTATMAVTPKTRPTPAMSA